VRTGGVWSGLTSAVRLLAAVVLLGCLLLIVVLVGQGVAAAELASPDATLQQRGPATPPAALAAGTAARGPAGLPRTLTAGAPTEPPAAANAFAAVSVPPSATPRGTADTASPRGGTPAPQERGTNATVPQVLAPLPDPRLRVAMTPVARREGEGDGDPEGGSGVTLAAATRQTAASATPAAVPVATSPQAPIAGIVTPVMTSGRALGNAITASTAGQRVDLLPWRQSDLAGLAFRVKANAQAVEVQELQHQPDNACASAIASVQDLEQLVDFAQRNVVRTLKVQSAWVDAAAKQANLNAARAREDADRVSASGEPTSPELLSVSRRIAPVVRAGVEVITQMMTVFAPGPFRDREFYRQAGQVKEHADRYGRLVTADPPDEGAGAELTLALSGLQDLSDHARAAANNLRQRAEAVDRAAVAAWDVATVARGELNAPRKPQPLPGFPVDRRADGEPEPPAGTGATGHSEQVVSVPTAPQAAGRGDHTTSAPPVENRSAPLTGTDPAAPPAHVSPSVAAASPNDAGWADGDSSLPFDNNDLFADVTVSAFTNSADNG